MTQLTSFSRDPQGSAVLIIDAGPLAVLFERRGDRFVHRVVSAGTEDSLALLESVEGDPNDDWPASPPLQDLHIQRDDLQHVALATGMAGSSHWSLSVCADRQTGYLTFDVACRVRRSVLWSGLLTRPRTPTEGLTANCETFGQGDGTVGDHAITGKLASAYRRLIDPRDARCALCAVALDDGSVATVETNADSLVVRPAVDGIELPATIRWQYRISVQ